MCENYAKTLVTVIMKHPVMLFEAEIQSHLISAVFELNLSRAWLSGQINDWA